MAGNRTLKLSILADVDDLNKKLKAANNDVETSSNKLGDFGKKAGLAFAAAAAAAGAFAVKIAVDAVKAASDLGETISKVGVLFGDSSKEIQKFAEGAASSLGQTKQQALDAAATFATFGKSAGLTGKDLSKFSIDFVKLASDLASFNNTSPEQAINAIGAALRGEAEPLRAYGVLLDDASMRQAALELGIVNTTKNALTPQQKVLAAQELIFRQTAAAQGDFDRTSDGLANRTRILTAELENAKATIGEALLPIVLELATFFSENVIPIVNNLTAAFGSSEDESLGVNGILRTLAGVIQELVIPIFNGMKKAFDSIKKAVIENKDEFIGFFEVLKAAAPIIGTIIGKAFEIIGKIASTVLNLVAQVLSAIKPMLNTAIDGINLVIRGLNLIKTGQDIPYISKIGESGGSAGGFSGTMPDGTSFNTGSSVGGNAGGNSGGSNLGSGGADALAAAAAAAKKAAEDAGVGGNFNPGRFREAEERSMGNSPVPPGSGIGDNFNPGRFRQGEMGSLAGSPRPDGMSGRGFNPDPNLAGSSMPPSNYYSINVTGALDPIGVARQIADIINNEATLSGGFNNLGGSRLVNIT